jgi:hypothetical protein
MSTPLYLNPEITVISAPPLKELVRATFDRSVGGLGALDDSVYNIHGFCGRKHRLFHNNLLNSIYDGAHEEEDQYDGALAVLKRLAGEGVLIVDDWNWRQVRRGTHRAIADLGATVDLAIEVRTTNDDSLVPSEGFGGGSDWHNGVFVAVISQRR